jgi:NAD(P)-dependent dehydrogenase (short-subunit alcohol dehydrogenase family)
MRFKDKVVFVTGGTRGLGKAMAEAFLKEGARVGVSGRKGEAVTRFEEEFRQKPARAFTADMSDYAAMEAVAEKVVQEWGGIDILVNNAGIINPLLPSEKMKREDFDKVIDVNLKGAFYTTQIFGRKMIERSAGRILFISSQVALFGEKGFLPYAISKAGLQLMTRSLASEWGRFGVTLCCIAPGYIKGGMNEGLIKKQQLVDFLSSKTPVHRMGTVEELVATVLFLASPEAAYINGETVVMDGGLTGYAAETLLDAIMKGR